MIRKANELDLEEIRSCFEIAKRKMVSDGNLTQWEKIDYPFCYSKEDISKGQCYVVVDDNKVIGATFVLIEGKDPTYSSIEGKWLNENDYVTIHRIASNNKMNNIFHEVINYAKSFNKDIRIDTHINNKRMIHLINKEGFIYTGVIYVKDGTPRNAYQLERRE